MQSQLNRKLGTWAQKCPKEGISGSISFWMINNPSWHQNKILISNMIKIPILRLDSGRMTICQQKRCWSFYNFTINPKTLVLSLAMKNDGLWNGLSWNVHLWMSLNQNYLFANKWSVSSILSNIIKSWSPNSLYIWMWTYWSTSSLLLSFHKYMNIYF